MTDRDYPTFHDNDPLVEEARPLKVFRDEELHPDWIGTTFQFICCDCNLKHHVAVMYNPKTNEVMFATARDDRGTAQYRRHGDCYLQKEEGSGKWKMIRK